MIVSTCGFMDSFLGDSKELLASQWGEDPRLQVTGFDEAAISFDAQTRFP
jgi:hypothetical protein